MRLLLTTDTVGGVWTFSKELTAGLLSRGHAVALVSFGRAPNTDQRIWVNGVEARFGGDQFRFISTDVPLEWMDTNERAYDEGLAALAQVQREFGVDAVHSSQFCFGALPFDVPVVVTAHSDVLSWAEACRGDGLPQSDWLMRYCAMVQRGLNAGDAVVAPTEWMLEALGRGFRLPARREVIPNGRTLEMARSAAERTGVVSVGRLWDEAKNVAMLCDVRTDWPISIAGEQSFGEAHVKLDGSVTFLGALSEAEIHELFARSAIYVVTSRYEPFGLAPLEAAHCGCAVVAHEIDSLREVWADAAVYFADSRALERVLSAFASDAGLLAEYGGRAKRRAAMFSRERMAARYEGLYRDMVARRMSSEAGAAA